MKLKVVLILFALILQVGMNSCVFGQNSKGLYVDDFKNILGQQDKEQELLDYAKQNHFNYLILYNTAFIQRNKYPLDRKEGIEVWRAFIKKAKNEYGVSKIGIVGEKAASFIPALTYNEKVLYARTEKIDVFNIEFEFWNARLTNNSGYYCLSYLAKNGYECTSDGAFQFYIEQLDELKTFSKLAQVETETYIGNPSDEQLAQLSTKIDRLLIHYYRTHVDRIAFYKLNRLQVIEKVNPKLKIAPIFSSRENHLKPWLITHAIDEVKPIFFDQLKSIPEIKQESLNFDGIVWYRYTSMPRNK
ncbi:MAG: hypothetical protein JW857_08290 [Bacteroidales bacterium]|nr:hypothetical protein [Bacteroidales bacterium]